MQVVRLLIFFSSFTTRYFNQLIDIFINVESVDMDIDLLEKGNIIVMDMQFDCI